MKDNKKAVVVLEDGSLFEGTSFGVPGQRCAEMVFNTGMAGYQEVLTDPSYRGQMVVMTAPQIGNYGIDEKASESGGIHMEAFIVRECSHIPSHWESQMSLQAFLMKEDCMGVEGIDTRALTLRLRDKGAMRAIISTEDFNRERLLEQVMAAPGLIGRDLVREVTWKDSAFFEKIGVSSARTTGEPFLVVVYDFGVKRNILRCLAQSGCRVRVVKADAPASTVLDLSPDGVLLSNGPGDPEGVPYVIEEVKRLIGKVPLMGICLGHQILGLSLGGRSFKLKFGHHGVNHPVKNLKTGRVEITVQNHGFCIDPDSIKEAKVNITHLNLNDQTLEGITLPDEFLMSVQFHPEAAPGPHDARGFFGDFVGMMKRWRDERGRG